MGGGVGMFPGITVEVLGVPGTGVTDGMMGVELTVIGFFELMLLGIISLE